MIETIDHDGQVLAYVIRSGLPDQTTFLTPPDCNMQLGFVAYPAGGVIPRHLHLPVERQLVGTTEVLIVQRGRCEVDIYTDDKRLVATHELTLGDIIVAVAGGHGFRAQEDLVLLEIKQGPFYGDAASKERF